MVNELKTETTSDQAVGVDLTWEEPKPGVRTFSVRVWITRERDLLRSLGAESDEPGQWNYLAVAADLPGCASAGDTFDEATANLREAFVGCAMSYLENGGRIPWENGGDRPLFHEERRLTIEVPT